MDLTSSDIDKLNDGGVILVDGFPKRGSDGKRFINRLTTFNVSDTITIPKNNIDDNNKMKNDILSNNVYDSKIVGIINYSPFAGRMLQNQIELIYTKEGYEKVNGKINSNGLGFCFNGDKAAQKDSLEYFDKIKDSKAYTYIDLGSMKEQTNSIFMQVEFFVYCFIIIVSIISVINIFNTISTGIITRKKEFSMLKAVGMTDSQLRRSVIFEGTFYGVISAIIGGISSAVLLFVLLRLGGDIGIVSYKFDVIPFALSIICAVFITYLSTIIPLKKLKKITIVQGISDEN